MAAEREPFEIRGYHLGNYVLLLAILNGDGVLRYLAIEIVESGRVDEAVEQFTDRAIVHLGDEEPERIFPGYKQDVVGTTQEHEHIYRQRKRVVTQRFLTLPDDYPVRVLTNKPDELCKVCIFGEHCTAFPYDLEDGFTIQEHFGLRVRAGDEISMKEVRWTLSSLAYNMSY